MEQEKLRRDRLDKVMAEPKRERKAKVKARCPDCRRMMTIHYWEHRGITDLICPNCHSLVYEEELEL